MSNAIIFILSGLLYVAGVLGMFYGYGQHQYEEGLDVFRYPSDTDSFSTIIDGQRIEMTYGKIKELMVQDISKLPRVIKNQ